VWTDVPKPEIRHGRSFLRELLETVVLIAAIYAFVNLATARFVVDGRSMLPNFNTDQFIIVSRLSYILGEPKRGDVVVFHNPADPTHDFIKRVIGLPGETVTIQNGRVYVNGVRLEEPYIQNFCRGTVCDDTWEIGPRVLRARITVAPAGTRTTSARSAASCWWAAPSFATGRRPTGR